MRVENQTKTRVWEDSSCALKPRLKIPFKNSTSDRWDCSESAIISFEICAAFVIKGWARGTFAHVQCIQIEYICSAKIWYWDQLLILIVTYEIIILRYCSCIPCFSLLFIARSSLLGAEKYTVLSKHLIEIGWVPLRQQLLMSLHFILHTSTNFSFLEIVRALK